MPSVHQSNQVSNVPAYDSLEERFGENPARFVYAGEELAIARLKGVRDCEFPEGITATEYVRAFRAVARKMNASYRVMNAIEERLETLEGE